MLNQLFKRLLTDDELKKLLECYNVFDIGDNNIITYLSLKTHNTIEKLYNILDILLEVYLPCKYSFINNLNIKRSLTILRQVLRLYDYTLQKYQVSKGFIYKIEKKNEKKIKIELNKTIIF